MMLVNSPITTPDWVDPELPLDVNLQVVRDILADHAQVVRNATIEDFDAELAPYINEAVFQVGSQLAGSKGSCSTEAWTIFTSQYESDSDPLPVCSIYDKQGELVFHAVRHGDELAVGCNSLIDAHLLQAVDALRSEPDPNQTGIHHVKAEMDRLGGFAPDGSKALVTAHIALKQSNATEFKGQLYQFNRTEDGGIQVSDTLRQAPLYQMSPAGQITQGQVAPADRKAFSHMYERLTEYAAAQAVQPTPTRPTTKAAGGRD